jgi:hypothetical protein
MKTSALLITGAFTILFAGFGTISETEYPNLEVARLPNGKTVSVAFDGFAADVWKHVPIEGCEQMVDNEVISDASKFLGGQTN